MTLKWELNDTSYQNFHEADWKVAKWYDTNTWTGEKITLMALADDQKAMLSASGKFTVVGFGEITILALDSQEMNVVLATATDKLGNKGRALTYIDYISKEFACISVN